MKHLYLNSKPSYRSTAFAVGCAYASFIFSFFYGPLSLLVMVTSFVALLAHRVSQPLVEATQEPGYTYIPALEIVVLNACIMAACTVAGVLPQLANTFSCFAAFVGAVQQLIYFFFYISS